MAIEGSFRKLKYTIGLSSFHVYKSEYIKQEIWAKLIAYNITETLISLTVVKHGQTKHEYKVNVSMTAHIYRVSLRLYTIASIEESKNISYKDLMQTLLKIKAGKMDGKWVVYPIKKSVQRLCGKMQFNPNDLTYRAVRDHRP